MTNQFRGQKTKTIIAEINEEFQWDVHNLFLFFEKLILKNIK